MSIPAAPPRRWSARPASLATSRLGTGPCSSPAWPAAGRSSAASPAGRTTSAPSPPWPPWGHRSTPPAPAGWKIVGRGLHGLRAPVEDLDCGNSGTSIRLLAGVLAAQRFPSRLFGDRYLNARPMRRVVDPLTRMGAVLRGVAGKKPDDTYPPLSIDPAAGLHGIRHESRIASAQVKSAVLLCGLWAEGPTEVLEPARSRDHTERMLRSFGVPLSTSDGPEGALSRLDPAGWKRDLPAFELEVPGDLSSAAFLLGAAVAVPGSRLLLRGVGLNPTRSGVLDALAALCPGAVTVHDRREVTGEEIADLHIDTGPGGSNGALHPINIDGALAVRALDELPLLSALSALCEGTTTIAGAAELRVKESDRIAATCALLRSFGVECEDAPTACWCTAGVAGGSSPRGSTASAITASPWPPPSWHWPPLGRPGSPIRAMWTPAFRLRRNTSGAGRPRSDLKEADPDTRSQGASPRI